MPLIKPSQKKTTTFSKGQTKSSHKTKDKEVDQGLDYTHFKKANLQNDDEWLKREINLIKSTSMEKNEINDNGKDDDIMQLKKYKQAKNKTRDEYKKEKWEEVGQYSNSSLNLSTKQPDENKQKVFYKDELDLLESEGCKELSQALRKTYVSIKQYSADIPKIKSSIKHFARHAPLCPNCSDSIEKQWLENNNSNDDDKTNKNEDETIRTNGFNQNFDEDPDSEVETKLTSSSKAWIFNKNHSDSDE